MNRLLAIPVMAIFTACASTLPPQPTTDAQAPSPTDIPVVVKKRAAKYAGLTEYSLEYSLINAWTRTPIYKKNVERAKFIREDGTTFSLDCGELNDKISMAIVTSTQPHTTFREANDLIIQRFHYEIGSRALECPTLDA